MSSDLSLSKEIISGTTRYKYFNTLTNQEKAKVISNILDNTSKGLFNGIILGGVIFGISHSTSLAYLTVGYFVGKSYLKSKNDFFSTYKIWSTKVNYLKWILSKLIILIINK